MAIKYKATVKGVDELKRTLTKHGNRARKATLRRINVGFKAPYALYVHENTEMKWQGLPRKSGIGVYWGPHGQAKFLEEPARELKPQIAARIVQVTRSTKSVFRGLYSGGVLLRNAAQKLVPVEYGELHDSAFIEVTY